MNLKILSCAFIAGMALAGPPALAASSGSLEKSVLATEDAYAKAVVARDGAALSTLLCPELLYMHAGGEVTPLDAYLKIALDPASRLRAIRFGERRVLASAKVASVTGKVTYDMGVDRNALYSATYLRKKGKWCVAAWQNTADRAAAK